MNPRVRAARLGTLLAGLYIVQSAYLGVTATPGLIYVGSLFAHFFGGLALAAGVVWMGLRGIRAARQASSGAAVPGAVALALFVASVISSLVLVKLHNTTQTRWLLHLHIVTSVLSVIAGLWALARHASGKDSFAAGATRILGVSCLVALVVAGARSFGGSLDLGNDVIRNPARPPFEMADESMGGADGPFFPSSAETSIGGPVPSDFFMTSEACKRCHEDVYDQWERSAHHFASFNNQWYRKSIEYMQEVNGVESAKWCGGCHDHALLFSGMMSWPTEDFIATPEAHTGLGCNSCHAIVGVKGTMGNGGFQIDYPPLHDLATSDKPLLRWLHDLAVRLDPGPHRRAFLKPFHREQVSEFCSSCHKVHLDAPVNNYRWLRGFNEYDNWQASGVSGQGARSFYYPPKSMDCADCHMPAVPSEDDGNVEGYVHDHSFPAANTALPTANLDGDQLLSVIRFLQAGQISVDIFAAGPARAIEPAARIPGEGAPQLASTFAVGEEAAMAIGRAAGAAREPDPLWGPLNRTEVKVRRGEEVRVDAVVRTRNVGHFFPGGTIDAFDVWLELRARDEHGRVIFWSGVARDNGEGPVDEGAHFYGARMVDARGNPIDKRNAWATRAVAWINLIPPGAADTAHFRLSIPEDCGDTVSLEARLNYRKFSTANTRFSFAGRPAEGEPPGPGPRIDRVSPHHDDREFVDGPVPADVSAALREIPILPIVVMSEARATLHVVEPGSDVANELVEGLPTDRARWNDYGIGLLRQGDMQGARRAFRKVTRLEPGYADGWVNLARVALREGLLDEAAAALEKALELEPDLAKAHYFTGVALKEQGEYDRALGHLERALSRYPRDRVVLNAIGRVKFLQRRFDEAVATLQAVLDIDPEDLMAHYNLMLAYRGLGRIEESDAERRLYERFKADEDANIILGPYLRENPDDNRMRQPIHEQVSVPAELIAHEWSLRRRAGEPHVVRPGEADDFVRRMVERGERLLAEGKGAERHAGPAGKR